MTGRIEQIVAHESDGVMRRATPENADRLCTDDDRCAAVDLTELPAAEDDRGRAASTAPGAATQNEVEPLSTANESESEKSPSASPTRTFRRALMRRWPIAAAVVVVAALGITTLWSGLQYRDDAVLAAADREFAPAAADAAAAILSYRPDIVTADLARARSHLTGDFAAYFDKLGTQVVVPAATGRHMSSTATVTATSVVSTSSDHAVALVFVNQVTTADDLKQPTTMSSSLRLELQKIGGHWLVSKLDTV